MIDLLWTDFHWEQPGRLWALLIVPVLMGWTVRQVRGGLRAMLLVNARQAYDSAVALSQPLGLWQRLQPVWLIALLLTGLILLWAGPTANHLHSEHPVELMLVLDNSPSMLARDLNGQSRLVVARNAAQNLLRDLPAGVRPGVVLFSGNITVLSGPSDHPKALAAQLNQWDEATITPNTALGDALATALRQFTPSHPQNSPVNLQPYPSQGDGMVRAVVLLSDGDSFQGKPWQEVVPLARARHIPIYTIGLGGDAPTVVEYQGETLPVTLNKPVLRAIAQDTGGRYFDASDSDSLEGVFTLLRQGALRQVSRPVSLRPQLAMGLILLAIGLWLSWVGRWRLWLL